MLFSVMFVIFLYGIVKDESILERLKKKQLLITEYLLFFVFYGEVLSDAYNSDLLQYMTIKSALLLFLLGLFYNLPIILSIILLHKDSLRHKFQTTKLKYIAYGVMIIHIGYVTYTVVSVFIH